MKSLVIMVIMVAACFFLYSCQKEKEARIKYYKSQNRDPLFFGDWINVNPTNKTIYRYNPDGTSYILNEEISPSKDFIYKKDESSMLYYYTKGNILYSLIAEKGIKYGSMEYNQKYKFINDTLNLNGHNIAIKLKMK